MVRKDYETARRRGWALKGAAGPCTVRYGVRKGIRHAIERRHRHGALRGGPGRAGAGGGAACEGGGGRRPTGAGARRVLGGLGPDFFLGGQFRLDRKAAEQAFADFMTRARGAGSGARFKDSSELARG